MLSLRMKRGSQILQNFPRDGPGADQGNAEHFCFSCEQIFESRDHLEEHMCASASFICSCGTEFTDYKDMREHSTTHEPGHQVLDHVTIKKRRIERLREEQEKLKKLQKGGVPPKAPNPGNGQSGSLLVKPILQVPNTSALLSQVPVQFPQVPQVYPTLLQPSSLSNPLGLVKSTKNISPDVSAPTVDLWTLYQPVVILKTSDSSKKRKPYTCAKCEQGFMSKVTLITHCNLHASDKISGCIGCGMLLCSKKLFPRYHACSAPTNQTKFKVVTAKPLNYKPPSNATGQNPPRTVSLLQFKNHNPSKGRQALATTSIQMAKNHNMRTYDNNRGFCITTALQTKTLNPSTVKMSTGVAGPSKIQNLHASSQSRQGFPATFSQRQKMNKNAASDVVRKSTGDFKCRVCHLPFDSPQLLQRHKCVKAREFMARHMASSKQNFKFNNVTPVIGPTSGPKNLGISHSGTKTSQFMALGLEKGKGGVSVNGVLEVDDDDDDEDDDNDDCYIVESGSDKPAEMIYQVTSSVPIKT